jgi:hypothetical protein
MKTKRQSAQVIPLGVTSRERPSSPDERTLPEVAEVDGKRVVIRGHEEVVLQCGEATIILRASGKVIIRGVQIESHARGLNRIKGSGVKVN